MEKVLFRISAIYNLAAVRNISYFENETMEYAVYQAINILIYSDSSDIQHRKAFES